MDSPESSNKPSLLERLSAFLLREPEDREQLVHLLHSAYENNLLDADAPAVAALVQGRVAVRCAHDLAHRRRGRGT